jgi:hypothetical protein
LIRERKRRETKHKRRGWGVEVGVLGEGRKGREESTTCRWMLERERKDRRDGKEERNLVATTSTSVRPTTARLLEAVATSGHAATTTSTSAAVEPWDVCAFGGNLHSIG